MGQDLSCRNFYRFWVALMIFAGVAGHPGAAMADTQRDICTMGDNSPVVTDTEGDVTITIDGSRTSRRDEMRRRFAECRGLYTAGQNSPIVASTGGNVRIDIIQRLRERFAAENVRGIITDMGANTLYFRPEFDDSQIYSIVNPRAVPRRLRGPVVLVTGRMNRFGQLRVSNVSLVANAQRQGDTPLTASEAERLSGTAQAYLLALSSLVQGETEVTAERIEQLGLETRNEFAHVYQRALDTGDQALRDEVIDQYAFVTRQQKAIYGSYDNFPAWTYRRIYENARSTVAIGEPGAPRALCSGFVIGDGLAMTAGHCFQNHAPANLEIWIDYASSEAGTTNEWPRHRITRLVAPGPEDQEALLRRDFSDTLYDFAIVEFETTSTAGQGVPDTVKSQCLRRFDVARNRKLYVVGYPEGRRVTVHDNGRVYLPFNVRQNELSALRMEIETDYQNHEERERIMEQFVSSYRPVQVSETRTAWRLYDVTLQDQPKLGIIADTFKGNSGSPIYDRDTHCVAGVLFNGAPDRGVRLAASWLLHESALPMTAILDYLETNPETRWLITDGRLTIQQ